MSGKTARMTRIRRWWHLLPGLPAACLGLCLAGAAVAADNPFFAMDTGTRDATHQSSAQQVSLVKELGFAGIGPTFTSVEALKEMLAEADKQGSKVIALYAGLKMNSADTGLQGVRKAIVALKGRDAILWLYMQDSARNPSDPSGDAQAVAVLRELADLAGQNGVRLALYPHAGFWVERVDDAVRLAKQVSHKSLGVTFNLCHWLMVDGKDLQARLEAARPYLFVVTVNGADAGGKDWSRLIQPLDAGTYDIGPLLAELKKLKFAGPVGLQHFGIAGDARKNLERSIGEWRKKEAP